MQQPGIPSSVSTIGIEEREEVRRLRQKLSEADAELQELRQTDRSKLVRETKTKVDDILNNDIFTHIEALTQVVDSNGDLVDVPKARFIGLYFGSFSCKACAKFSRDLECFLDTVSPSDVSILYVSSDQSPAELDAFLRGKTFLYGVPWDREKVRRGLYRCAQVLFTPTLFVLDTETRTTATRFGASSVLYNPQNALLSWKRGVSGYFPDWFERRRIVSFNFGGFLVWTLTLLAILHFGFGFTLNTVWHYYNVIFGGKL